MYVEGNIVSRIIAVALMFLNWSCGTTLIQKSLTLTSLRCALSTLDAFISRTSICSAASSILGASFFASDVHGPSAETRKGSRRKRRMSVDSLLLLAAVKSLFEVCGQARQKIGHHWWYFSVGYFICCIMHSQAREMQLSRGEISFNKAQLRSE